MSRLQGGFDVGSGKTKLVVARVANGKVEEVLYSKQIDVQYSWDLAANDDNNLSRAILTKGEAAIAELKAAGEAVGCTNYTGVATAVFRTADNGAKFLKHIADTHGIRLSVASQALEGKLGHSTAVSQRQSIAPDDLVMYDSGGGSFQIVAVPVDATSDDTPLSVAVHGGPFGEIEALRVLEVDIRKGKVSTHQTPNPVTMAEAQQVIERLTVKLPILDESVAMRMQQPRTHVVGIGEKTCIFAIASQALEGETLLTHRNVMHAIELTCDKSDIEQEAMGLPEVHLTLPKLCLLYAAMVHYGIKQVCKPSIIQFHPPNLLHSQAYRER
eukprot:TRINITY_DN8388_c0_g2_i1.p1 TRINITY_DN8388_c0_g2~~TRINITY_DN8388_c0_g2_i1.p1  ORF type:complete len:328 (+),score=59.53 TRINITY_DN8388_c0_g2_i1:65-1048(+)